MGLLHIRHQGSNIAALTRAGLSSLGSRPSDPPVTPGPVIRSTVKPLPQSLRDDFVRWCGGDPAVWDDQVPPFLFPQWGLPSLGRTVSDIPWPITRVVNQGCRLEIKAPLPAGEPLVVTAQLLSTEVTERRARLHQRLITGTATVPEALVADVFAVVPLSRSGGSKREPPVVPEDHRRLAPIGAEAGAGWQFALLTGDFNPIHWLGPVARMSGFRGVILQGFGTFARVGQALVEDWLDGDGRQLASMDVRFVRPLVVRSDVALHVGNEDDGALPIAVGDGLGGTAQMLGTAHRRQTHE
ncbi:MAG: MaoC family dehydratase [Deltaproteobacteria bacterium]|nr:MaoC family dehydratase [Deltaproteobacteria bacterium]